MNVVNLAGNPTADPVESTYTYKDKDGNEKNGRRASFVLAVSVSNGRRYEEATFVRCVAFNNNAKIVIDRVKCGKRSLFRDI
ncbi:MAG: single-stranded DNA-binding protein [Eubacterium ventriosum]